jgi:hypothetical protein
MKGGSHRTALHLLWCGPAVDGQSGDRQPSRCRNRNILTHLVSSIGRYGTWLSIWVSQRSVLA